MSEATEFEPELARTRVQDATRGLVTWTALALSAHVGAVALFLVTVTEPRVNLELESMPVELIRLGTPRDPKLLPRRVRPPPSTRTERRPPAPSNQQGVALEGPEPKKAKPAKRPRKLSQAARDLLEGGDTDLDSLLEKAVPEGQEDGFRNGTASDATFAANAYEAKVKAALDEAYELPLAVQAQSRFLNAQVAIFIDRSGRIARYEFIRRHDSKPFMSALERMLKTIKLPPPPAELASTYRKNGLEIHFSP